MGTAARRMLPARAARRATRRAHRCRSRSSPERRGLARERRTPASAPGRLRVSVRWPRLIARLASISLAMPKSSSLTFPSLADQHVGWLDIAVDDQVGVGVRDRGEYVQKERRRASMPSAFTVTVLVDALALDLLQDQVRLARRGDTGVDEPSDVRVSKTGENVAFAPEPLLAGTPDQRGVQELDRDRALRSARRCAGRARPFPCRPARAATPGYRRRRPDRRASRAAEGRSALARGNPSLPDARASSRSVSTSAASAGSSPVARRAIRHAHPPRAPARDRATG